VRLIEGDATDDAVLEQAGIQRARSIIACADSDANNVFITLTARELREDIRIVARAAVEDTEKKLRRAGADRVISPYKASGTEMARLAIHRQLSGVLQLDHRYRIEEIEVGEASDGVGRTIGQLSGEVTVVGLCRGPDFEPKPHADTALLAGDVVVAMGPPPVLERLELMLEARG
jgi:voltage-gated potassium channel